MRWQTGRTPTGPEGLATLPGCSVGTMAEQRDHEGEQEAENKQASKVGQEVTLLLVLR